MAEFTNLNKESVVKYRSKNTTKIWICEIDIFIRIRKTFTNVHKRRNSKNTKHIRLSFLVQVRNFYYLFKFKVFCHEERETQFLTMLTVRTSSAHDSLTQQTQGTFRRPQLVSPRRTPKINSPRLSPKHD